MVQQRRQPVAAGLQYVGQRTVRGAAPLRWGGGVDGPAQQWAVEAEPVAGPGEGVGEGVGAGGGCGGGAQASQGVQDQAGVGVRSVRCPYGRRHRQQQVADVRGLTGQRPAGYRRQRPGVGRRVGQRPEPAQFGGREPADEGEEQGRVALGLGQQLLADGRGGGAVGHVVEQGVGVRRCERVEADDGEAGVLRVDGTVSGDGEEQRDASHGVQAFGRVAEGGSGRRVPQVRVVGADEEGRLAGRRPQGAEQFPGGGVRAAVRTGPEVQYRAGPEGVGGPLEEGGPAEPWFAGHDEVAAVGAQPVQQGPHRLPLRAPAVDPHGRTYGRLSGHPREVTRA
ncbi:hypothetical protein [Streptomyces sp. AC602_WCS936]|uniref:hypothetical protein n=1 Tax=Streptomyces sp. AC602_WCS936 TaxID=2823685 RepID=UPI0035AE23DE